LRRRWLQIETCVEQQIWCYRYLARGRQQLLKLSLCHGFDLVIITHIPNGLCAALIVCIIGLNATTSRTTIARGIGHTAAVAEIAVAAVLQRFLAKFTAAGAVAAHTARRLTAAQTHGTTIDAMACGVHTQLANAICDGLAGVTIQLLNIFAHVAAA